MFGCTLDSIRCIFIVLVFIKIIVDTDQIAKQLPRPLSRFSSKFLWVVFCLWLTFQHIDNYILMMPISVRYSCFFSDIEIYWKIADSNFFEFSGNLKFYLFFGFQVYWYLQKPVSRLFSISLHIFIVQSHLSHSILRRVGSLLGAYLAIYACA